MWKEAHSLAERPHAAKAALHARYSPDRPKSGGTKADRHVKQPKRSEVQASYGTSSTGRLRSGKGNAQHNAIHGGNEATYEQFGRVTMDSMEEKLGAVLSNPQLMQQIMSMASSLSQSNEASKEETTAPSLPAFDPKLLAQLSGLSGQGTVDNDQRTLLNALCPYLSSDRISRLEKAMRAAKMARVASTFLNQGGLSLLTGR